MFGLGKLLGIQPLVETLTGCGASWICQTMASVEGTLTKARSLIKLEKKIKLLVLKFYMVRITKFICLGMPVTLQKIRDFDEELGSKK